MIHINNIGDKKGIIALVMVLSTMMLVGALAFFTLVSGRFTTTTHLYRKTQAIRLAESASYVVYEMIAKGHITPVNGDTYTITFLNNKRVRVRLNGTAPPYEVRATYLD
jgi:putative Ca2+/H+ antiporter (TMEM165/GDT1 family)